MKKKSMHIYMALMLLLVASSFTFSFLAIGDAMASYELLMRKN